MTKKPSVIPTEDDNHNWTEDFSHENGNYQNQCRDCGEYFIGHKRRCWCKLCASSPSPSSISVACKEYIDKQNHVNFIYDEIAEDAFLAGAEWQQSQQVKPVKKSEEDKGTIAVERYIKKLHSFIPDTFHPDKAIEYRIRMLWVGQQSQVKQASCTHENTVWENQGFTLYCRDCKTSINDRDASQVKPVSNENAQLKQNLADIRELLDWTITEDDIQKIINICNKHLEP